jgi:Zn-dependent protease
MTHSAKGIFYFSPQEKKDLIISWLTLSLAFAVLFFQPKTPGVVITSFIVMLFVVGTGFVLHELAHREAAKYYGFHSEYRAWYPGLVIALILAISPLKLIFAAPGATYFFADKVSLKQNGIISLAGPVTNLVLGIVLSLVVLQLGNNIFDQVLVSAIKINFFFALFNLLPISILDGSKIFTWNKSIWMATFCTSLILAIFPGIVFPDINFNNSFF